MGSEKTLTTFHVFKMSDIVYPDSGETRAVWVPSGDVQARDRDHALRVYAMQAADTDSDPVNGTFVAVSEVAWQPRKMSVKSEPKIEITPA
jgi:hypothetical protein